MTTEILEHSIAGETLHRGTGDVQSLQTAVAGDRLADGGADSAHDEIAAAADPAPSAVDNNIYFTVDPYTGVRTLTKTGWARREAIVSGYSQSYGKTGRGTGIIALRYFL